MDPQLALVDLDKYLAGLILSIGRVRLESGDANFKAIAAVAETLSIQFDAHSVPSRIEPERSEVRLIYFVGVAFSAAANSRLSFATSRRKREMPLSGT
jgi:hypothetical protein